MSKIHTELKMHKSEMCPDGENALIKVVLSKGCGTEVCYSCHCFSSPSRFLSQPDALQQAVSVSLVGLAPWTCIPTAALHKLLHF